MKLRYYLRGLGIGIVVTAVIMMVALGNKQPMTDEEVIIRAKELGLIENTVLKDVVTAKDEEQTAEEKTEDVQEELQEEVATEDITDDKTSTEEVKDESEEEPQEEPQKEVPEDTQDKATSEDVEQGVITVSVVSGDSSWSVAKRMEEAGLVDSARDFDTYLCGNGYDKRISVGTYDIPTNATQEEMAKIITKMN